MNKNKKNKTIVYPAGPEKYYNVKNVFVALAILFILSNSLTSCTSKNVSSSTEIGKEVVLSLNPSEDNPRNSEGAFIQLKDGRILFIYTHFTGGGGDDVKAHPAGRYSSDGGKTEDEVILSHEGGECDERKPVKV